MIWLRFWTCLGMSYLYVLFNCSYGGAGGHSVRTSQFAEFREALVGTAQANKVQEGCREFINFYRPFTGFTIKITTVCGKIALKKSMVFCMTHRIFTHEIVHRHRYSFRPQEASQGLFQYQTTQALQALHAPHTSLEPFKRFKTFARLPRRLRKA